MSATLPDRPAPEAPAGPHAEGTEEVLWGEPDRPEPEAPATDDESDEILWGEPAEDAES